MFTCSTGAQKKVAAIVSSINIIRAGSREKLPSGTPGNEQEGSQKRREVMGAAGRVLGVSMWAAPSEYWG